VRTEFGLQRERCDEVAGRLAKALEPLWRSWHLIPAVGHRQQWRERDQADLQLCRQRAALRWCGKGRLGRCTAGCTCI